MTYVKFTHANNKVPVYVTKELTWNVYYSEGHKSTFIVSNGGSVIPVVEPVAEVLERVFGQIASEEGHPNGT